MHSRAIAAMALASCFGTGVGLTAQSVAPRAPGASEPPPPPVTWSLALAPGAQARAGGVFTAIVRAKIEAGWHVYAIGQRPGGPIALTIVVPEDPTFSRSAPVVEPAPRKTFDMAFGIDTLFHTTAAAFALPVRVAAGAAKRAHPLRVEVEFQACKDTLCLPPATTVLKLDVAVG